MLKGQQTIEFGALSGGPGAEVAMPVILESRSDEHRFSAVILFDAERLSFVGAGIGIDGAGANLTATVGVRTRREWNWELNCPWAGSFCLGGGNWPWCDLVCGLTRWKVRVSSHSARIRNYRLSSMSNERRTTDPEVKQSCVSRIFG